MQNIIVLCLSAASILNSVSILLLTRKEKKEIMMIMNNEAVIEMDEYKHMLRQIKEYSDEIKMLEERCDQLTEDYKGAMDSLLEYQELVTEEYELKERRCDYYRRLVVELKRSFTEDDFNRLAHTVWGEVMKGVKFNE